MSEKLDGIRGIWDGKTLISKNNYPINPPKEWLENFPPFSLDGELWLSYNAFEKTSSIIRNSKSTLKEWKQITYYVFDVPNICEKCNLKERLGILEEYLKSHFTPQIKIIPQIPIQNQEHLQSYFQEILAKNGEGLILRDNINSNIAYKYKAYEDSECEVIGYTQGKGKFKGQLGAILCQAFIDGAYKTFKIGSGFSNKERKSPPPIHSIITYKYFGFTANKLPKFPVFLRIRDKNF